MFGLLTILFMAQLVLVRGRMTFVGVGDGGRRGSVFDLMSLSSSLREIVVPLKGWGK